MKTKYTATSTLEDSTVWSYESKYNCTESIEERLAYLERCVKDLSYDLEKHERWSDIRFIFSMIIFITLLILLK